MGLLKSLGGVVSIEITSADVAGVLREINAMDITLLNVIHTADLSVQCCLHRKDFAAVTKLLDRRGEKAEIVKKEGLYWTGIRVLKRPVLLVGMSILLLLAMFLPTRIFFVKVEGNTAIPSRLIIQKAELCGIAFGASRREVRSEKMKNALLAAIPELQWAGVNTSGCVATVSVREKSTAEIQNKTTDGVSSIIAARDGIITECTVLRGNALCRVGQAVKAGQTLVSGYTDCGISIQVTRADAQITAQTLRDLEVVTPASAAVRGEITGQETKYSLLIGKKLINFYKCSGISDTSCVKMYSEDYLTLPGGFQLPVALVTEQWIYYDTNAVQFMEEASYEWLEAYSEDYLLGQMIAGQILDAESLLRLQSGTCILTGQYACQEMIGQVVSEEIINSGESN